MPRKKSSQADEARKRGISPQRVWQLEQVKAGNCRNCGKPRGTHAVYCDECAEKAAQRMREKRGYKPWKKGGRGRPPKSEQ